MRLLCACSRKSYMLSTLEIYIPGAASNSETAVLQGAPLEFPRLPRVTARISQIPSGLVLMDNIAIRQR